MANNLEEFNNETISELEYLKLLSKRYPSIASALTEIINLEAILNLPKGTEHFLTDLHGEYEPFVHVLKNGSGVIKIKIQEMFGRQLTELEQKSLATLVYYPEQKLDIVLKNESNINDWYRITLYRLIKLCRYAASKYTRSKVRKALPKDFAYIIEELLHEQAKYEDKEQYYEGIINTIIEIGRAKEFIIAICKLIQRLVIDRLHIIGDIFDRGPRPDIILDTLMEYHSVDIQWGNHDMLWMAAAAGCKGCMANVLRFSARYSNLDVIEDIYGINLLPLATYALKYYKDDPCIEFRPKVKQEDICNNHEVDLIAKMHKAIAMLQFKIEYEIIKRHPEFEMEERLLLHKINFDKGTITINNIEYKLKDKYFPTIDPKDPYKLTEEENILIEKLSASFVNSEKLQKHITFLFAKGSMYLKYNSNLLFHGCIPVNEDKSFKSMIIQGKSYKGKALLEKFEKLAREGYFNKESIEEKQYAMDIMWYLGNGCCSSLFGKRGMATFERYFIDDKEIQKEKKNPYYKFREDEDMCNRIFEEFGLDPNTSRIVNGHVPVRRKQGESPIKANGKLLVIDGGFSKAYRGKTGIAGYTLIYNSYGMRLVAHEPFESIEAAISEEKDIISTELIVDKEVVRKRVSDTDVGEELKKQISKLKLLLTAYSKGLINEKI